LRIRRGAYLPHWTREGAIYAVTFRLADALPQSVVNAWEKEREEIVVRAHRQKRELNQPERAELQRLFSEKVEKYLDAGHGACWMKQPPVADLIEKALKHFDGERYRLLAWCVMPNHVHVVVKPASGQKLSAINHSWKSYTANKANRLLGRSGTFWQPEPYDHLIRDDADLEHAIEYVLNNPIAAGLQNWRWVGHANDLSLILEGGTGILPVTEREFHVQDGHATRGTGILTVSESRSHGQDGRATGKDSRGTGILPVSESIHGQDGRATEGGR
jgi:REP element-mobilizing transposase RayT